MVLWDFDPRISSIKMPHVNATFDRLLFGQLTNKLQFHPLVLKNGLSTRLIVVPIRIFQ